jgi:RimK family alpha-L-glutamate ligase
LHALARLGVPVVNEARAIERCVDKSMTSFLLHRAGIATPDTLVTEDAAVARRHLSRAAEDLVQKPLFGSQGRGLARLPPRSELPAPEASAGVYYLQRFVGRDEAWRDFRVMVVGGAPIAAMERRGRGWITNVRQGGRCAAAALSRPLAELSVGAAEAVGADYAGVDLIERRDGALLVLEVNSAPAWRGLQGVTSADIAAAIARHVLDRLA